MTTPLVVVTGPRAFGGSGLFRALADRLRRPAVALDEIEEELAEGAEDTPREWLRYDAEAELVRRVEAAGGEAVVDVRPTLRRDAVRIRALLEPWWDHAVEVRCQVPARDLAEPAAGLGAPRTVVIDTSRAVDLGDVVTAVRRETRPVLPRRAR